ncbi:MAG: hypothetical protein EAX96_09865 [Candidatus Lokiarchaeota archaeon]|nr:hypothetical protein [Candidatus Lokiarchaeota archaeon]
MFLTLNILAFFGNLIICPIAAIILLKQWYFSDRRFLTDLPFLLGLSFISAFIDNIDSTIGFILNFKQNVYSGILSASIMIIILTFMLIIITDLIFNEKSKKSRYIILFLSAILLELLAIILILFDLHVIFVMFINVCLALPTTIVFAFTFIQCYRQERLPNINPLYIGIGFSLYSISWIIKTIMFATLDPISYVFPAWIFIGYFLDILAYSIAIYGFTHKAPY